jgi:pectate lyase
MILRSSTVLGLAAALVLVAILPSVHAQYPKISPEVQSQSVARKAAADLASDEAFARALPVIKEWEARGKPYRPWAAEPKDLLQASIPAFPGAEGGGMYAFGGRGGRIFVIRTLADSGPGSFREALEAGGPRLVIFNVAGIIQLQSRIRIRAPYITIAGNTAPGDGVCIAGDTVELESHDIVIRHLRFRRGAMWVGDRNDSIGGNPTGNIMIDHVSASWGLDENMSMYRHMYQPPDGSKELKLPTVNISIQHSIFSEALNTYHHAFGSTIGGLNSTFHHNLWANNTGRNPSVGMYGDFTFVNNVLFNWVHRTVDGGDHRSFFTIINNYLKPGPATPTSAPVAWRLLKPESERSKTVKDHFGKAYVAGNVVEGNERVTKDNWDGGVQPDSHAPTATVIPTIRSEVPFAHAPLTIQPARQAYDYVLAHAGATLPKRDAVDTRVIEMVRSGKVSAVSINPKISEEFAKVGFSEKTGAEIVKLVHKGIITDPKQVGGYPIYAGQPYADADGDGLPDAWEQQHGLNPKSAADASADLNEDGYTNIEDFINGLDPRAPKVDWSDLKHNRDPRNAPLL